jgi:hypothetical protein
VRAPQTEFQQVGFDIGASAEPFLNFAVRVAYGRTYEEGRGPKGPRAEQFKPQ